jgi:hypothetical protein
VATECRYTKLLETCEHENDPERPRQKPDLGPGARKGRGTAQSAQRQRALLADTIAYAGANSPYYRELCRELPEPVECPEVLPVTDKKTLMAHFDDWCVDRENSGGSKGDLPRS